MFHPYYNFYKQVQYLYSTVASASEHNWYNTTHVETEINPYNMSLLGPKNLLKKGCKMTSDDFNIDSPDTVDVKPVVEFIEGNPNTLVAANPSFTGQLNVR